MPKSVIKESWVKIEQQKRCRHSSLVGEGKKTKGGPTLPHSHTLTFLLVIPSQL